MKWLGGVQLGPFKWKAKGVCFLGLNTLDAGEVSKAMQENAVIAGSLGGEWGRVGDIVSEAAAQGIEELFKNKPNSGTHSGSAPDFTRNPTLQQVQGRAPPPPNS